MDAREGEHPERKARKVSAESVAAQANCNIITLLFSGCQIVLGAGRISIIVALGFVFVAGRVTGRAVGDVADEEALCCFGIRDQRQPMF